jgi:uncharacterized protein (TIGR02466 family)
MSNRQERRRAERDAKKEKGGMNPLLAKMPLKMIQPWSVPVLYTKLPDEILQKMIEISDNVIDDEKSLNHGKNLAGQIETELLVDHEILKNAGVFQFFHEVIQQYVIQQKCQQYPFNVEQVQRETWLVNMLSMWVVSQQSNEYNPIHIHTECQLSSVMYLKIPKFLPTKKTHRAHDDGAITFVSNSSYDTELSHPSLTMRPAVGDFFIFGAKQQHMVYPYRCEEGDTERRSISFNAVFQSQTDYNKLQKEREV